MRKLELLLVSILLLASITFAASSPSMQPITKNSSYFNHSLSFEVPQNWSVVKDFKEGNDTQIVLSDGVVNAIRIDLIKNKILGEYIDLNSNAAISAYYQSKVIQPIALEGNHWSGSGGLSVKPDGAEAGYSTNEYSPQGHSDVNVLEWVLAWTKRNYDDEIIGVHSAFQNGTFSEIEVGGGNSRATYKMPEPLWTVLTTLNRGDKPLPRTSPQGSSLAESV